MAVQKAAINDPKIAIGVQHLDVGYRANGVDLVLFEQLNLELLSGDMICFMGPNGVGKSTLIRTLLGLQIPLSGSIYYNGVEASQVDHARQVAAVLTDRVSALNMNVSDLVSFGRYPYLNWQARMNPDDVRIVHQAMEQVHVDALATKKIHTLSDGQLQLVMIARALAQDTPIILLDEPTAHLDLNNRLEIMMLLRKLAHELNKAILVASHELDLALQTADRIWLATADKKIVTGIPEDLVLAGTFDEIFQLKGFDLKTGKVQHIAYRTESIRLVGTGPSFLWTKNALERSGYAVVDEGFHVTVEVVGTVERPGWKVNENFFASLALVLNYLDTPSV